MLISGIQTRIAYASLKQIIVSALMLFMLSFSKKFGQREAPSATQSDCYLILGPFSYKHWGKFSKGTKCLTVDDEPSGRWLTSASGIKPDICDDFKTFTEREERLPMPSVQRKDRSIKPKLCLDRHNKKCIILSNFIVTGY